MKNSVHGIKMENVRNRIDVKLVSNKKDYLKWTFKPSYMSHKIFDNDLVTKRKNKIALLLNKPEYILRCILELSKVLMYRFHYNYIKNKCGNNSVVITLETRLLFTDASSLLYETKSEDAYDNFSNNKEMFDFSNYSAKSRYDNSNKLEVGKMKDETDGVDIFIFGTR